MADDWRPTLRAPAAAVSLVHGSTGAVLVPALELALERRARRRGLLGRAELPARSALILAPCAAIHTIGMRCAIDVVFVDRSGAVLSTREPLVPWRMAVCPAAFAVVELRAGAVREMGIAPGDHLSLVPVVTAPARAAAVP